MVYYSNYLVHRKQNFPDPGLIDIDRSATDSAWICLLLSSHLTCLRWHRDDHRNPNKARSRGYYDTGRDHCDNCGDIWRNNALCINANGVSRVCQNIPILLSSLINHLRSHWRNAKKGWIDRSIHLLARS
jgi:hypothetical protein